MRAGISSLEEIVGESFNGANLAKAKLLLLLD